MYNNFTAFAAFLSKTQRNFPKGIDGEEIFWYDLEEEMICKLGFSGKE